MKTIYYLLNKKKNKRKSNFYNIWYCGLAFFFITTSISYANEKVEDNSFISGPIPQIFSSENKETEVLPSGKIRVFVDKNRVKSIVVGKQDCSIMRNEADLYGFGFKIGGLLYSLGPEIYYGHSLGINWNWANQIMVAEFQELCTRFNTGRLSREEYSEEVNEIINRSRNYKIELEKRLKTKKDKFFQEIDKMRLTSAPCS